MNAGLRALRVEQWWHFVVLPAACFSVGPPVLVTQIIACAIAAAGCLAWAYGVNAIAEQGSDHSPRKNPLVASPQSTRAAWQWSLGAALVAVLAALRLGPIASTCVAVSLACGALYSLGPRLKARPGAGLLANLGIFFPLLAIGLDGVRVGPSRAFGALAITFVALLSQNQLVHELADADEDAASGAVTTARWLGASRVRVATVACALFGGVGVVVIAAPLRLSIAALLTLVIGTVVSAMPAHDFAARRKIHRFASLACGAALFALGAWR